LTWVSASQAAAVVLAAGLAGPLGALAGPGLLVTLLLTATLGCGAAAALERTAGSDDYTTPGAPPPLMAGLAWLLAAGAALGLPPLWGFWPRLWLLQAVQEQQPGLLLPLLGGSTLMALALIAPLARLLSGTDRPAAGWADTLPTALAGLPLFALGLAPSLAWMVWLAALPFAPAALPATVGAQLAAAGAGLILMLLLVGMLRAPSGRTLARDPDEGPALLGPDALSEALRPLAWLASPLPLLAGLWRGLQWGSEGLRFFMGLFEQRYYLLGVLAALLTIMLLMAQ
jgi:formate hydrogenlyase subunit 3/multisubunit Na+/H+ antiporter MnhD subunit